MSFFFFKQKTAYEMRISDWSSDVCSSDLLAHPHARGFVGRDAQGHFFLFKAQDIESQLHARDFGLLQLDDAPHAMLRINDIVTYFTDERIGGHSVSFLWSLPGVHRQDSVASAPRSGGECAFRSPLAP